MIMKTFRTYEYHKSVLRVYERMPRLNVSYDHRAFRMATSACAELKYRDRGTKIHEAILEHDSTLIEKNEFIVTGLYQIDLRKI